MQQTGKKLSALEQRVLTTIKTRALISPGDHVLAAVSGGADSVSLLHILHGLQKRLGIQLTVAHMDHRIRSEEARLEAEFVRGLCEGLGIACIIESRDVPGYKAQSSLSLQEAARDMRYGFFSDALAAAGANKLALAHQADDQAETVLMRLMRGSSLKGLAGIPACRDGYIIRPLIDIERQEIEAWLRERDFSFVADTSAGEQQYLRNKIRHGLMPLLKREYNPGIIRTLGRTADLLRQDEAALMEMVALKTGPAGAGEHSIEIAALQQAGPHLYGRLVRHIIAGLKGDLRSLTQRHIQAVISLIDKPGPGRTVHLPEKWCVRRQYGSLIFSRGQAAQKTFCYQSPEIPAALDILETGSRLLFEMVPVDESRALFKNADAQVAFIAPELALGPVTVRSWLAGDIFHPLGSPGRKKVKDLFIELKIPRPQRRRVPILLFDQQIAWVGGLRLDDRFKLLSGHHRTALRVRLETGLQI